MEDREVQTVLIELGEAALPHNLLKRRFMGLSGAPGDQPPPKELSPEVLEYDRSGKFKITAGRETLTP